MSVRVVAVCLLAFGTACSKGPIEAAFQQPLGSGSKSTPGIGKKSIAFGTESGSVFYYGFNGAYLARFQASKEVISTPVYDQETDSFFFGSTSYVFYATSGLGKKKWSFATRDRIKGDPLVSGGVVYFGSYDDHLYALGIERGRRKWVFPKAVAAPAAPADAGDGDEAGEETEKAAPARPAVDTGEFAYSQPALSDGVVYVGNMDGYLYAIDAKSGLMKWRFKSAGAVTSSPWVEDGVVYFGSNDNHVYAVQLSDQKELWKKETGGWVNASPVVSGGVLYVGSDDGKLYALDPKSGDEKWAFDTGGEIKSRPAFKDNLVFITSGARQGGLWAIDTTTGKLFWSDKMVGKVESDPVIRGDTLYLTTGDNRFLGYKITATTTGG